MPLPSFGHVLSALNPPTSQPGQLPCPQEPFMPQQNMQQSLRVCIVTPSAPKGPPKRFQDLFLMTILQALCCYRLWAVGNRYKQLLACGMC